MKPITQHKRHHVNLWSQWAATGVVHNVGEYLLALESNAMAIRTGMNCWMQHLAIWVYAKKMRWETRLEHLWRGCMLWQHSICNVAEQCVGKELKFSIASRCDKVWGYWNISRGHS